MPLTNVFQIVISNLFIWGKKLSRAKVIEKCHRTVLQTQ